MLYQINKGVKFYGTQTVLDGVQFSVNEGEKIAIVGRNGAGKTTLLKIMMQEVSLESGEIHQSGKLEIGYLSQHVFEDEQKSVKDVMYEVFLPLQALERELQQMEKEMEHNHSEAFMESYAARSHAFEMQGGYTYHTEIMTLFTKFGFDPADFTKALHAFSGGQKTRLGLIRLLLSKPDILLLDEPTNHLDLETISWLEGYLKRYPKAIVLVSHDRKFIDNIATSIWEIEFGKMRQYPGNYTQFVQQKKAYQERMHSTFVRQSKEIARIEGQIEKFRYKSSKAAFAQSKIKYLERMDKVDEVHVDEKVFNAQFISKIKGGKQVLVLDELSIGYDHELAR
ncbi:MAG: ABC-F family ATP-binding cassette domain-containing protein, partial [Erysipelotrichaceae bacterium]